MYSVAVWSLRGRLGSDSFKLMKQKMFTNIAWMGEALNFCFVDFVCGSRG